MELLIIALFAGIIYYQVGWIQGLVTFIVLGLIERVYKANKRLKETSEEYLKARGNLEVSLQKRHDLIVKLMDVVKSELKELDPEREMLLSMMKKVEETDPYKKGLFKIDKKDVREWYTQTTILVDKINSTLKMVKNTDFQTVKKAIIDVEDELSASRRYLNFSVKNYNLSVKEKFNFFSVRKNDYQLADYFEVTSPEIREDVVVSFDRNYL